MGKWATRLAEEFLDVSPEGTDKTDTTPLSSVLSVGIPGASVEIQPLGPHALSKVEAEIAHAQAWDEPACERFVGRVSHLMRLGFHATDADDLAERLHLRDITRDDRRMCVECRHYQPAKRDVCANPIVAGVRVRGPHEAMQLQRCPGYEEPAERLEQTVGKPHGA